MDLFMMLEEGDLNKVQQLVEREFVSVNAQDSTGETPLHWAIWSGGHLSVVEYLIGKGADIHAQNFVEGATPLHYASWKGHLSVVEVLVGKGADIHTQENDGLTPLHWACWKGHLSVLEFLVGKGADIHVQNTIGETPVDMAIRRGKQDVVGYLERMTKVRQCHSFVLYLVQEGFFNKANSEERTVKNND